MFSPRIRRYLRLQQILTALASLLFGMLLSVLSNWLSEQWKTLLPWVGVAFAICFISAIIVTIRQPANIEVLIRAPRTLRAPHEAKNYARRGFVGFIPLYNPIGFTLSEQEIKDAVDTLDFDRLKLEDSNLKPTIHAVLSHAERLEHCWLLATRGKDLPGSLVYARLLTEYLKQRKGLSCQFHFGEEYSITLDDDALVLSKTYDQVRQVFSDAEKKGVAANEIVANITTGFRSMTLGMVLACLDRDRDIEFIGTHYNALGKPSQELLPITFSFEPFLE
ncbi:MAG: hypothetical protein HZB19_22415 [Chloroflexi bacterium]|nr:hypothetical protein [Chloroflexota bacterium]